MRVLKVCLNENFIEQVYKDCVISFSRHIEDRKTNAIHNLNGYLDRKNKLSIEEIQEYKSNVELFKLLTCFRSDEESLNLISDSSEVLIQNLKSMIDEISKCQTIESSQFENSKINLDNIKLISSCFPEIIEKYQVICKNYHTNFEQLEIGTFEYVKSHEFNKVCCNINLIRKGQKIFHEHFDLTSIIEIIDKRVIDSLKDVSQNVEDTLRKTRTRRLEGDEINKIKEIVEKLEDARDVFRSYIFSTEINKINETMIENINNYFELLTKKVQDLFETNRTNSFKEMETYVKAMKSLRSIPIIELKTSERYYSIIQKIKGKLDTISKETHSCLSETPKSLKIYANIYSNICYLKEAKWIDYDETSEENKSGFTEELILSIKKELISKISDLHQSIKELDMANYENIVVAHKYLEEFQSITQFEIDIPELKDFKDDSYKIFNESIDSNLKLIGQTFNLKNEKKNILAELNEIKKKYDSLNCPDSNKTSMLNELEDIVRINEINKNKFENMKKHESELKKQIEEALMLNVEIEKRETYLCQIGFENIDDLKNKYELVLNELKELENLINKKNQQIESSLKKPKRQESIEKKVASSNQESQGARDFIQSTKYKNIKKLENEIKTIKNEIESHSENTEYIFNRFNSELTEYSINYLNTCNSIPSIRLKSNLVKNEFDSYLRFYREYIKNDIMYILDEKLNFPTKNNSVFDYAQRLKNHLNDLKDIANQALLENVFKSSQIMSEAMEKMQNLLMILFEQLSRDGGEQKDLKDRFQIVKALSTVNTSDKNFQSLYRDYQFAVSKEFKKFYIRLTNFIQNNEYQNVATELLSISENPVNENSFNQIRNLLSNSIINLIEKTKQNAGIHCRNLETNHIENISGNLKRLQCARLHIAVNFDEHNKNRFRTDGFINEETKEILIKGIVTIEETLNSKIMKYLETIKALINVYEFYDAEEKLEHLKTILLILGSNCKIEERVAEQVEEMQNTLDSIVSKVLEKYKTLPIRDYVLKPPKEIIEKFEKVKHRNSKYVEGLSELKNLILNNITAELESCNNAPPDNRKAKLVDIKSMIGSLPIELNQAISTRIKSVEETFNSKENILNEEYKQITSNSFEISAVQNFMEKCEKDGWMGLLNEMKNAIIKKSTEYKEIIIKNLKDDDIRNALIEFKNLFEYKVSFKQVAKTIEGQLDEMEKQFKKRYVNVENTLIRIVEIEDEKIITQSFEQFKEFTRLKGELSTIMEIYNKSERRDAIEKSIASLDLINEIDKGIEKVFKVLLDFFENYRLMYLDAKNNLNMENLNSCLNNMRKWNPLLTDIKIFS